MLNKTFIFIGLFFLLQTTSINAQEIKGRIIDPENKAVDYATVILQNTDSVFVEAAYTDEQGQFQFQSGLENFRLVVNHLLYETVGKSYYKHDTILIQLTAKDYILDEVVIRGERPLIEVADGKLSYNVPRLIKDKVVSNAYEALLQLPEVMESEGKPTLIGSNSLNIIINGKPSTMSPDQLTELLKNMPSSMVEKAEVMYAAPPQYHIRGGAINLVLKNKADKNLFGEVNAAYTQQHYGNYKIGGSLFYNNSKLSSDLLYSFGKHKSRSGLDVVSHHLLGNGIYDIEQHNKGRRKAQSHNIRVGLDYNINEKSNISLVYTSEIIPSFNAIEFSSGNYSNSVNEKSGTDPEQMHNIGINFTSGSGLSIGSDYTYFQDHTQQNFSDYIGEEHTAFKSNSNQDINRIKVYIDKSHSLKNDWSIKYGANFTYARDKSSQVYHSLNNFEPSNSFNKQKEYTYDIYAGFSKSFSPAFNVSAYVTGEYYKLNDYTEWSLFPSLTSIYTHSPDHMFQLNLSTNKAYPAYWEMNGTISYLSGYAELHGNPQLKPSNSYETQLSYIYKKKYILSLYNTYNDNYFVQLPYQSSEKLTLIYKTTNFDFLHRIGINTIIPFSKGLLSSRLILNGFYYHAKSSHFHDINFDKARFIFYSQLSNTFNISSNIKAELSGAYISKSLQGPSDIGSIVKLDAAVKWTFAKDKAELRLNGNDLFNSWVPDLTMRFANQNLFMNVLDDSRTISLSFTYKFGKSMEQKERKEIDTSRFGK